jgi:hypothetical protein
MWPFAHKSVVMNLSKDIRSSLIAERGIRDETIDSLRMVEDRGQYAGRPVTYFRVYDPDNAKWGTSEPRNYADLNASRILHSGHTEKDGHIVLNRQVVGI